MMRIDKKAVAVLALVMTARSVCAFSTWGPLEGWQTADLNYGTARGTGITWAGESDGGNPELGGPKNYNMGSRLNVPIVTYAFDFSFLQYFGAKGVASVDSAMVLLNGLPTAS